MSQCLLSQGVTLRNSGPQVFLSHSLPWLVLVCSPGATGVVTAAAGRVEKTWSQEAGPGSGLLACVALDNSPLSLGLSICKVRW